MGDNKRFVNQNQEILKQRVSGLYSTPGDIRSEYYRDYTRILHSLAYRRLKHKTQVFYNISNDHICTRMEHVSHVEAVSHSIADGLNLDRELTSAIAIGHDLGHAPFGHHGEAVLNELSKEYFTEEYKKKHFGKDNERLFWHEKNGVRFVDNIELLPDLQGHYTNLNLTYAVRDGIISHCGEIDENSIRPRKEAIDLYDFKEPGQYQPYTWEGCVVKISDKIAYLGRDIEDAMALGMLNEMNIKDLEKIAVKHGKKVINTSALMHSMINDICEYSSPENGICLGEDNLSLLNEIKNYNYNVIYNSNLFYTYKKYAKLVLKSIFEILYQAYESGYTIVSIKNKYLKVYPTLTNAFIRWLAKYCVNDMVEKNDQELLSDITVIENEKIYGNLSEKDIYVQAIIDFISGMTDAFAIKIFNELLQFSKV